MNGGGHDQHKAAPLRVEASATPSLAEPEAWGPGGLPDRSGAGGGAVSGAECRVDGCERIARIEWNYCDSHTRELIYAALGGRT